MKNSTYETCRRGKWWRVVWPFFMNLARNGCEKLLFKWKKDCSVNIWLWINNDKKKTEAIRWKTNLQNQSQLWHLTRFGFFTSHYRGEFLDFEEEFWRGRRRREMASNLWNLLRLQMSKQFQVLSLSWKSEKYCWDKLEI